MNDDRCMFEQFLSEAADDIRQYETARGRAHHDGATKALRQLRVHVWKARDSWMLVEFHYHQKATPLPWWSMQVAEDLPTAIRQYLQALREELDIDYLPGAGAAVLKIQQLIEGTYEDSQDANPRADEELDSEVDCAFCSKINRVGRVQKQFQCVACGMVDTIDDD